MDFKDDYAALGVVPTASQEEIKRAYRRLARKYHPDVSKEPDADARLKDVAAACEALSDAERRAACDDVVKRRQQGEAFSPPPGWDSGFEFSDRDGGSQGGAGNFDHSDFFESLFGRQGMRGQRAQRAQGPVTGQDHHAKVQIDLLGSYRGGQRSISMRVPQQDASGRMALRECQFDLNIPKGIQDGQHLRLAGQGEPVHSDGPVAPWEAALGASVTVSTTDGSVQLSVPAGSSAGRKLRLKGKGLPCTPPGDLYAVLQVALPPADTEAAQAGYREMEKAFTSFQPRRTLET